MTEMSQGLVAALKTASASINREMTKMTVASIEKHDSKLNKGTIVHTAYDDYTLIEQIGEGGNGRVFSASSNSEEKVAIKFVERNIGKDKLKRFKNEMSFCSQHNHPNIVKILDTGYAYSNDKDYIFYVMPLYSVTLEKKMKEGMPHDKALDIFIGLLTGLKYAHENGCIHRDIKPKNIMLEGDGLKPIICDFGIAHFAEEELYTLVETRATDRMANFYYAAPEQYRQGAKACPQTDIYSAALILNEMFTGDIPQAAGYKTIAEVNADYAYLDKVFEKLFKQNPDERLYPENNILTEIKVLADNQKREQDKIKLQNTINKVSGVEPFEARIVDMKYESGALVFFFNVNLPDDWLHIIKYESYSATFMLSYSKELLQQVGKNALSMRLLGGENDNTIKNIVKNLKQWVEAVNSIYTDRLKRKAAFEQRQKEEQRFAEIKRLEEETRINSSLNALLTEL